jgi:hypothetical protein
VSHREAAKHSHVVHLTQVDLIGGLFFHPLNVFLSRHLEATHCQREVFSLNALKKGAVVPRLRRTILTIDVANLFFIAT